MESSLWSRLSLALLISIFGGFLFFTQRQTNTTVVVSQQAAEPILTDAAARYSPKQKISQMLAVSVTLSNTSTASASKQIQELNTLQPGFVVIYGKKLTSAIVKNSTQEIKNLTIPLPITLAVDHEGGLVQRLSGAGFTPLDTWETLCAVDQTLRKKTFETSARELKENGINLVLGPTIDSSTSSSKALGTRLCHADSSVLLQSTIEVIESYLAFGITPTLKHYPGIGSLDVDLHDTYAEISDENHERSLFYTLLTQYPKIAVMSAHAGLPTTDLPCSLDKTCLAPLQQFSDALIITDDLNMKSIQQNHSKDDLSNLSFSVQQAIEAGNTVMLLGPSVPLTTVQHISEDLVQRYITDAGFAKQIDDNFIKILRWKRQEQSKL